MIVKVKCFGNLEFEKTIKLHIYNTLQNMQFYSNIIPALESVYILRFLLSAWQSQAGGTVSL